MVRLSWSKRSADDLYNIYEYISRDSIHYAKIQVKRIKERTTILLSSPKIGRIVPEKENDNIRELVFGNYRIVYKIASEENIVIITIHHSRKILKI